MLPQLLHQHVLWLTDRLGNDGIDSVGAHRVRHLSAAVAHVQLPRRRPRPAVWPSRERRRANRQRGDGDAPLAGGFIGIIPALGMLDPPVVLSTGQMLAWAAALTYFGICFAVPLRRQTILVEKLTFPSGTATAKLIQLLHGGALPTGTALDAYSSIGSPGGPRGVGGGRGVTGGVGGLDRYACDDAEYDDDGEAGEAMMSGLASEAPWRVLGLSFGASFGLSALVYLTLPSADPTLHIFSWIGLPSFTTWGDLRPALSFVGQVRARSAPARSAPALCTRALCTRALCTGALCTRAGRRPLPVPSRPLSLPLCLSLSASPALTLSPQPQPSNPNPNLSLSSRSLGHDHGDAPVSRSRRRRARGACWGRWRAAAGAGQDLRLRVRRAGVGALGPSHSWWVNR